MDNEVSHILATRMWTAPPVVHKVIHNWIHGESRSTALKADMELIFHVSTAIHEQHEGFTGVIMNPRPQCA
ncbi:MAG: hypothetical protein BRD25_05280 [Bacteroidetes bacterium QH_1_61_8]|nr:MAG: hypothetical protein BRD25_05280 [Bacteroidetes bacterium QH_1_61_8]